MMVDLILPILFFIVDGIVLIALGVPLLQGQVSPNSWYGFRTRKTLSDEKIWYAVNRVAGKDMILAGAIIILSSLILLPLGGRVSFERAVATLLIITLLSVAWMIIHGYSVLKKM
jgi:uncharacterized membrane protein